MGDTVVDINHAPLEILEQLKGVGKAKAQAIIFCRENKPNKFFDSLSELLDIPGISRSILCQNNKVLTCSHKRKNSTVNPASKKKMINGGDTVGSSGVNGESNPLGLCESPSGSRESHSRDDSGSSRQSSVFDGESSEEEEPQFDEDICYQYMDQEDTNQSAIAGYIKPDQYPSGSIVLDGTSSESIRQDKSPLSSRLKKEPSFCAGLGGDTPNEEAVSDSIDVPLSPMRLTDGEDLEFPNHPSKDHKSDDVPVVEDPIVEKMSSLISSKTQNKRKSELCSESKSLCPVKKSFKAVDTNGEPEERLVDISCDSYKCLKPTPPPALKQWLSKFTSWTGSQKIIALNSLINVCDTGQVRHIHHTILPQFQRDFISLLPKELALLVLSFLRPKDLVGAAQTCRYWNMLTADNLLWKRKCKEARVENLKQIMSMKPPRRTSSASHTSNFKVAFLRQHRIEMNWRNKEITSPRVLRGHDDHVITCLQFSNNVIVSGSDDNTLKVWNATTGKYIRSLTGHTGGVWSSQMCSKYIVSGSTDRMVRVWSADTFECIHTLYGHTSTVRCLHLHNDKVVSGSRDATLRVWDVIRGVCEHVLVGHVAAVRCVQYNGKLVVSGAYDFLVKVWNPETEECIHTLQGHTNRVYSLQFDGVHVVSGSLDTSIRVWDVVSGECKHTLMGHQSLTSGMELKNNILISGNADSTVKVWDILTGQCLQTLSGPNKHRSAVTCLQFNNKFVVTSSDDGTVKLWDVKTGEFIRNLVGLQSGGSGGVVWRIRASETQLVCAVGSRNGTEDTKLLVLDFDGETATAK